MTAMQTGIAADVTGQVADIQPVQHGSAAVVGDLHPPTTAAPGILSRGAPAANPRAATRARSNSRTPERGRTPDRGRTSTLQVTDLTPPQMNPKGGAQAKRRASSVATPASPPSPQQDSTLLTLISKMQQQIDALHRDKLRFEMDLLKRIEDNKEFSAKTTKAFVEASCRDVVRGIELEFTTADRFKSLLVGHDEPIFAALFEEVYVPKANIVKEKIDEIQAWIRERTNRDAQVENYISMLERDRPDEGVQIKLAFQSIIEEIRVLRVNAAAATQSAGPPTTTTDGTHDRKTTEQALPQPLEPSTAHVPMRAPPGYPGTIDDIIVRINELQSQFDAGKLRCHCEHVDYHEVQIQTLLSKTPMSAPAAVQPTCSPCNGSWDPWQQSRGHGDSEECQVRPGHCKHVAQLVVQMEAVESRLDDLEGDEEGVGDWADSTVGAQFGPGQRRARRGRPAETPTINGPMGLLTKPETNLFDDKLANQPGFGFDGHKGGPAWKTKLGNYFISKCPAARALLNWAEKFEGDSIPHSVLMEIASKPGSTMIPTLMDSFNNQVWGFLSNCLSAEAQTIFRGSEDLQGIDAWRSVVRYIDHGKSIQLEQMRREMKTHHLKPMKNLESVAIGIAEFELRLKEYAELGGAMPSDEEKKSDLLNILPGTLRESLLWRATDPGPYTRFRDMVRSQAARSLLQQQRLPLHRVEDQNSPPNRSDEDEEEPNIESMSRDDLVAYVKRNSGNPRDKRNPRNGGGNGTGSGPKAPRKCPNCGKEHKELKCPHPPVDIKDRPCWKCGKKGHVGRDCKEKIAALTEERRIGSLHGGTALRSLSALNDGFSMPKRTARPMPQRAVFNDFVPSTNRFSGLSQREKKVAFSLGPEGSTSRPTTDAGPCHSSPGTSSVVRKQPSPAPQLFDGTDDEVEDNKRILLNCQKEIHDKCCQLRDVRLNGGTNQLSLLERSGAGGEILSLAPAEVTIVVAADSGAVTHVIHPSQLPAGCVPTGANGDHFTGAGGEHIERFGEVDTVLTGSHGAAACAWDCADVSRALHSIAKVTGPEHGEGVHEVLFTNRRAVVVPAGFVESILQRTTPVLEYNRVGNLYLAEVKLSSFARQGQKR